MYGNQSNGGRSGGNRVYSSRNHRQPQVKSIDPARFIKAATAIKEVEVYDSKNTFADFGFSPRLAQNIISQGYVTPTPIQDGGIPVVMSGRDLIGLANTGTGKTAAFLLPIMHRMLNGEATRTLIMVPTRELAVQIEEEFRKFGAGLPLRSALVVGGASIGKQLAQIGRQPQFIIGTPGRLKDLIENYGLKFDGFSTLVLDEADRMLDMGFIRDIRSILDHFPPNRHTLFLSATITPEIQGLTSTILNNPETISVRKGETSDHVNQDVIYVDGKEAKEDKLAELLKDPAFTKVLVFGDTKWGVQKLADRLEQRGFKVAAIHGNKSQPQRQRALNDFKADRVQALIATDVAARGLDIPQVSHVINFDPPKIYEDYVHRIGRTGRAGHHGHALTFVPTQRNASPVPYRR
ncbi:DEAD/DEAH box helicase [Candidatus Saccharibacteria bacterium]|nr:DEAD/DEAH box helicase [Candidatus Saccharibacteria bacterium]